MVEGAESEALPREIQVVLLDWFQELEEIAPANQRSLVSGGKCHGIDFGPELA